MSGPLSGIRVIEIASVGPGPFACMMLADHGAEVIQVERPRSGDLESSDGGVNLLRRSRKSVVIDLKQADGVALVKDLCRGADGVVEGFRPKVMERLGLGPDVLLRENPRLVYGRMTGWGQEGTESLSAGHDINYIALSGALHAFGRENQKPAPPLNMIGDFGGGGMMLAFGMVSAILHARVTGQGQVVDAAMVDGSAVLMSMIWSLWGRGDWRDERGMNLLDGGAHFYDTYETADGKYVAVGAIEPQFYAEFLKRTGLNDDPEFRSQMDSDRWPRLKQKVAKVFQKKTRDEWCQIMEGCDACFTPVLSLSEAPAHPRNTSRSVFVNVGGVLQPAPATRYSRTDTATPTLPSKAGADSKFVLKELGYSETQIAELAERKVITVG